MRQMNGSLTGHHEKDANGKLGGGWLPSCERPFFFSREEWIGKNTLGCSSVARFLLPRALRNEVRVRERVMRLSLLWNGS